MSALPATADLTEQPITNQNDKGEVNEQGFYFKEHCADSYRLLEQHIGVCTVAWQPNDLAKF